MIDRNLEASHTVEINASVETLWEVLTNPEHIKVFLFGTETTTDWKVGSPILFEGKYNGQQYKDRGNVLQNIFGELLQYNYWSSFSGMEDIPSNYAVVSYLIKEKENGTLEFTWHQRGFKSEEGKCHTEEGLKPMLDQIKKLAEQ